MLKVDLDPQYRHRCCGHSDAATIAMTRLTCSRCGQVLSQSELQLGLDGYSHEDASGRRCGPVLEERAQSHAEMVDWLWQAATRSRG